MNADIDNLTFTVQEIFSLLGVAQCLYVLVYMVLRAGRISRALIPSLYFLVLGGAFLSDAAVRHWGPFLSGYTDIQWLLWFAGPPLSVLIAIQISQITRVPPLEYYFVLLLLPAAFVIGKFLSYDPAACGAERLFCQGHDESWMILTGVLAGALSLLSIWLGRNDMKTEIFQQKTYQERYWLILALVVMNTAFLSLMLLSLQEVVTGSELVYGRTFLGLGFAYVASTSLFRIYPQAVMVVPASRDLSREDMHISEQVEKLIYLDKVYQEPSYGRADMARELNISESVLSRIVNVRFNQSLPQLLNEHRVEDAKMLLQQTDLPIRSLAQESGFNSVATFNRVFKEITGVSPSEFREGYAQPVPEPKSDDGGAEESSGAIK